MIQNKHTQWQYHIYYTIFYSLSLNYQFFNVYLPQNKDGIMKKGLFLTITLAIVLSACNNRVQQNQKIVDIDSTITKTNKTIYDQLLEELDSTEIYNDSILYGYWFKPHEACAVNVFFHKNSRFELKYYIVENDTTIIDVDKKGTFTIGEADKNNHIMITMVSDDGWDDYFNGVMYYKNNGTNSYLTDKEEGLYLIKGCN